MRRLFWLGMGAAAGIYLARKVAQTAEAFTPQGIATGLAESLAILGDAVRDFADDVRAGSAEREALLVEALGIETGRPRVMTSTPLAAALPPVEATVDVDGTPLNRPHLPTPPSAQQTRPIGEH
ncbi:MAG: DUF6167 family protein [Motilibacteraceae bacterium]